VFSQPRDSNDHRLFSKLGDVERNTFSMFPNSDKEIHHVGNLSVFVFRSIGIQDSDREIDRDKLEVVFFNERGVDVASTSTGIKEGDDRELLMVVRSEAFDFDFRKLRGTHELDLRHVWDFFGQARERGIQEKRIGKRRYI
jgi:hypothetical protein